MGRLAQIASMRRSIIILLSTWVSAGLLSAEPLPITVGDGTINGDRFEPYTNRWEYSIKPPGKDVVKIGIWSDEMVAATVDGHAAYVRKQIAGSYKTGKSTVTVNTFDARTLAPLRREWIDRNPANFTRISFAGKALAVERFAAGPQPGPNAPPPAPIATSAEIQLNASVFDYHGGMWGMILAGAPLRVGFEGSFQTLDEFNPTISTVTFKVVRQEEVTAGPGKKVQAYVVEADSAKGGHLVFWITPEAPYVIRLVFTAGPGEWTYEML